MPAIPDSPDPRFKIDRPLQPGGMGDIYLATEKLTGESVVIKVLRDQLVDDAVSIERFDREASVLAELDHTCIVKLRHWGRYADGQRYFIMDYVPGHNLYDFLEENGPAPSYMTVGLGLDIASALDYCHRRGVVHRDVKPDNIILTPNEEGQFQQATLIDFGILKRVGIGAASSATAKGVLVGTPLFMSPEQANGLEVDGRADLYSLGCVLFNLATGKPPFEANSPFAVLQQHVFVAPDLSELKAVKTPPMLTDLIADLLAKEPRDRPADARQVINRLSGVARCTPIPSQPIYPVAQSKFATPMPTDMGPVVEPLALVQPARTMAPRPTPRREFNRPPAPPQPRERGLPLALIAAVVAVLLAGYAAWRALQGPSGPEGPPLTAEMKALQERCDTGVMPACIDLLNAYDHRLAPGDEARKKRLAAKVVTHFRSHCDSGDSYSCDAAADLTSRHGL